VNKYPKKKERENTEVIYLTEIVEDTALYLRLYVLDVGQLQEKAIPFVNDTKSAKNTNIVPESQSLSEPSSSFTTEAEVAHNLNMAKLVALKAAELGSTS